MKKLLKIVSLVVGLIASNSFVYGQGPCSCSNLSGANNPCATDGNLYPNLNDAKNATPVQVPMSPELPFATVGTEYVFCTKYTPPTGVTKVGILNFVGIYDDNNTNSNITRTWEAFATSACTSPIPGTIVPITPGGTATFDVTPGTEYRFCVKIRLNGALAGGKITRNEFYVYDATPAVTPTCTTCATATCTASSVTATTVGTARTDLTTKLAADGDQYGTLTLIPGETQTICVPAKVPVGSTKLGFKQKGFGKWADPLLPCTDKTQQVITSELRKSDCSAVIPPNTLNGTGAAVKSGFNPEWNNLTPGDYTLCYTINLTTNSDCDTYTLEGIGYYNVGNIPPPRPCQMQNGNTTTCNCVFTDSGDSTANYSGNEKYTYTLCPDVSTKKLTMTFRGLELNDVNDRLAIYDGQDTLSSILMSLANTTTFPAGSIRASNSNTSGCLTAQFKSDASGVKKGWIADISCSIPCTDPVAAEKTTEFGTNKSIKTCIGAQIEFDGSPSTANAPSITKYTWDFGDGTPKVDSLKAKHTYTKAGQYAPTLQVTNSAGCISTNAITTVVKIGSKPSFDGMRDTTICLDSTRCLNGVVNWPVVSNTPVIDPPPPTSIPELGGNMKIPIVIKGYGAGQKITSATDLQSICLNIEHSAISDLVVTLISPNGKKVILYKQSGPNKGGATVLGFPSMGKAALEKIGSATGCVWPPGSQNGFEAGKGLDYCFKMSAAKTWVQVDEAYDWWSTGAGTPLPNPPCLQVAAGDYKPIGKFDSLIGADINGTWILQVEDNVNNDDGKVFSWSLNLNPALLGSTSFTPTLSTQKWTALTGTDIASQTNNQVCITPTDTANTKYKYEVKDDFGCTFDTTITIVINTTCNCTPPAAPAAADTIVCLGDSVGLTATGVSGAVFKWYTAVADTAAKKIGLPFNTGGLTVKTSFWVTQSSGGCESPKKEVVVDINSAGSPLYTINHTDVNCSGLGSITIKDSSVNVLSHSWISGTIVAANLPVAATDSSALIGLNAGQYCVNIEKTTVSSGTSRVTLLTETFDTPSTYTINNASDEAGEAPGNETNNFAVDNDYLPGTCNYGGGSYTSPNISNQNASITGNIKSNYLKIVAQVTPGVTCGSGSSNWLPKSPNYASKVSNQKVTLNTAINTTGKSNVKLSYYWLCKGDPSGNDYGQFQYSTNGGSTWIDAGTKLTGTVANGAGEYDWKLDSISLPAWDNLASLKFRIKWVNDATSSKDPPLALDQIKVTADAPATSACPSKVKECVTIDPLTGVNPPVLSNDTTYCAGQTIANITATGTAGAKIIWYSDAALTTKLDSTDIYSPNYTIGTTTYYATQTVSGCQSLADSAKITILAYPTITVSLHKNQPCPSLFGEVVLSATDGSALNKWLYSINNGVTFVNTNSFTGLVPGDYTFLVKNDTNGCVKDTSLTIDSARTLMVIGPDSICKGDSAIFLAFGVKPYQWTSGAITGNDSIFAILVTTTTTITVNDSCNVATPKQRIVNPYSDPILTVSPDITICEGFTAKLEANVNGGSSPFMFTWSPTATLSSITYNNVNTSVISNPTVADKTYTYRVSLTDDCDLTASKDVNVRVNSAPKAEIYSKDAICQNDSLVFYNVKHNNTMTKYTWKYDNRSSNTVGKTVATFTKSGVFLVSVDVTDSAGCSTTVIDTFEVIKNPITIITPSATEKSIFNPIIMFDGADSHDNIKTYAWNFAGLGTDSLDKTSFAFPDTGVYVVQLNVKNSTVIKGKTYYCYDSSEVSITIKDEVALYIPNAFTPNNDGQNDMFSPKGFGFTKYEMRIFDRWGAEVFVSTDIENSWNGGMNGGDHKAKEDVYVYMIKVEPNNKKEKERVFTGHVSLIR